MSQTEAKRYNIYLDYAGYQIDPGSYRIMPAPLMGTKFATGRTAYATLDFWQVGAMTDFTKGINQKFLVDPSQYFYSQGIDVSQEGEFRLERDLETQAFPATPGAVTARYRSTTSLYVGTDSGKVYITADGITFTLDQNTGTGQIYGFYEYGDYLYATKGIADYTWRKNLSTNVWQECDGSGEAPTIEKLFFVMVESGLYAYGVFDDGIRQSKNGYTWTPTPPDPLWALPKSEGIALNAQPLPRGFLLGARRGLWLMIGGGSAVNLWLFPEYTSANNFKGFDKFSNFGIFSVENLGIFYSDGSGIYPTTLTWRGFGLHVRYVKSILSSGWDIFALVSDDNINWCLARCNMINAKAPRNWWIVKNFGVQVPAFLSSFDNSKVFVHFADGTCKKYNKESGPYQTSGYLQTSFSDENLVLLQKLYKTLSVILSEFPNKTSVKIGYRLKDSGGYTESTFAAASDGSDLDLDYDLANPILGSRIQLQIILGGDVITWNTAITPVVTDLLWKYILQSPTVDTTMKKTFHFTILAEDELEKLDFEKEELDLSEPRSRQDILDDLLTSANKKEVLNFVGVDNETYEAFKLKYVGAGSSCMVKIDRTNYKLITTIDGTEDQNISYKNLTIQALVNTLDALANYEAVIDESVKLTSISANNLFPVNNLEIIGGAQIYYGTDVYPVIFNPGSPGVFKLSIEGRGSDRIQVSLRES